MKKSILLGIFALFTYAVLLGFIVYQVADVLNFGILIEYRTQILNGAVLTLVLSAGALLTSIVTGFLFFLATKSRNRYIQLLTLFYNEIIMGTPLLVLVFVIVYIIGPAFGMSNKMALGFLSLTLYITPYMTNVFKGAYSTIGRNQFMVMDFYGFGTIDRYRFIILPQMIKPVLPGLINNLSGIIKGTSILSTIAINEIFYSVSLVSNRSYRYIEGYFILWAVYLVVTIPLSFLAKRLSLRWSRESNNGN